MELQKALKWMSLFNDKIQENKSYLSDLDTPIGDGDHGANMARGMAAVMAEIEGKSIEDTAELFKIVAMQLISKVGGASGPLYGSAFMGMAKADQTASIDKLLESGLEMIQKRGKATAGEKTMVDVWIPFISAFQKDQIDKETIEEALESTKEMVATKGRASYVGERSKGHLDPGACSSAYLFQALLESKVDNEG